MRNGRQTGRGMRSSRFEKGRVQPCDVADDKVSSHAVGAVTVDVDRFPCNEAGILRGGEQDRTGSSASHDDAGASARQGSEVSRCQSEKTPSTVPTEHSHIEVTSRRFRIGTERIVSEAKRV
jgi:hypothetical protein